MGLGAASEGVRAAIRNHNGGALKSDLDGGLGRRGEQIGIAMAKQENYRAGQTYFGYDNKYCFNTINSAIPSCNTFLDGTAGRGGFQAAPPFNYVNLFYSTPLLTADTLIQQYIAMLQLQAPVTNWRLDIGNDFYLLVSPTLVGRAMQIVHSIRDYFATSGGTARAGRRRGPLLPGRQRTDAPQPQD